MKKDKKQESKIEKTASKFNKDADLQEFYILKIGETLEDVAKKFNIDVNKLKELNGEVLGTNQIRMR